MVEQPEVKAFLHESTSTFSYVVWDPETRQAAVVDSVLHYEISSGCTSTRYADEIISFVREQKLETEWILETHAHADHVSAAAYLKKELGGRTAIGVGIRNVQNHFSKICNLGYEFLSDGPQFDHLFADGDTCKLGNFTIRVFATPGHTPDHVTYLIGDAIFVGDTLFMPDVGTARCDFPGGSAETLYQSIQRLFELPGATRMFVLHDYPPDGREFRCETTIAAQRQDNIHVGNNRSAADYIRLRSERDKTLTLPMLIIPAVQFNIRAGKLPPAEDNGVHYIKVPIDRPADFSTTSTEPHVI